MKPVYGITHELTGEPRVLEPKTTKVGIGLAKGKALHTYIDMSGKWVVYVGKDPKRFETKAEARKFYRDSKPNAPERAYPQRLPYFTFTRISPDGSYEPDWDAIESHGPLPTEIDIVFTRDEPFAASYQMWTATEKKCEGDGINADRVLSMAQGDNERALADQAERNGEKTFPIVNGCYTKGCPYGKASGDKPPACRPHGRLLFQLLNAPRLGGTAYFDTTGYRSISQLFSCIQTFKQVTGQGDADRGFVAGIPLKLVLRPYRTQHNGKATTQYGVSLEFRAENAYDLKRRLIEHGVNFRLADAGLRQLAPPPEPQELPANDDDVPEENAAAIVQEFYPEAPAQDNEDFSDPEAPASTPMPRRRSEAQVPQPEPADPDGSAAFDGCWDNPAAAIPPPPSPPPPESHPVMTNSGKPTPAPITPRPKPQPKPLSQKQRQVWEAARQRGATDAAITAQAGILGYESLAEVPDSEIGKMLAWARAFAQQTSMV